MRSGIILIYILIFFPTTVLGKISPNKHYKDTIKSTESEINFISTVKNNILERDKNGLIKIQREWPLLDPDVTFHDTMFYNPAYLPIVFDGFLLPEKLDFFQKDSLKNLNKFHLISPDETLAPMIKKNREIKEQRQQYFTDPYNIEKVKYCVSGLSKISTVKESEVNKKNIFQELVSTEEPISFTVPELAKVVPKRVYWIKKGEHSLQVAQNRITDNWSKGGSSSFYVRSNHKFNLNYAKDKVTFNNTWEWRLGAQHSSGDEAHKISVNEDLFRMYNVFGLKAFKRWSYSASLDTKTQIFNTYPVNSYNIKTSFLSPLYSNLGIGMSYNINKKFENTINKKVNFSMDISALSVDFRYVKNDKVDETKFGLKKDEKTQTDFGSKVNAKVDFSFNTFMSWYAEFYYFTNYKRIESEVQNKFNFLLNRYFSTTVNVHFRFDDNVPRSNGWGYLQMNEIVTFGLNYKW